MFVAAVQIQGLGLQLSRDEALLCLSEILLLQTCNGVGDGVEEEMVGFLIVHGDSSIIVIMVNIITIITIMKKVKLHIIGVG